LNRARRARRQWKESASVIEDRKLSPEEERTVEAHVRMPAPLVYEVIRRDGIEEMSRPASSLLWSGIAAGILISFSVLSEGLLRVHLPDLPWRPLVENLGYSVGFLIVIMGRMQLFTENTITTVLPTMGSPTRANLVCSARVWGIVFGANLIGATAAAAFFVWSNALSAGLLAAIDDISRHALAPGFAETFMRGIPAGILIASIVWMLPSAGNAAFNIVLLFTWLIALGDFTHVVAGSVEAIYLLFTGAVGIAGAVFGFLLPAFLGNVVGGTLVFALLAYGQVAEELPETDRKPPGDE
jgi:formate/nitrite transporter FocA (FNT family)